MTVYEWLTSNDDIIVNFNKTIYEDIDGDYECYDILKIQMDLGYECSVKTNSDHTLTRLPITIVRTFYGEQIPDNDADMLHILDQMYQDSIAVFNIMKYKNK